MAVAYDTATESSTWTTTPDPFTFTHTPSGTPRAALLYIVHGETTSVEIDGTPTYGGVSFTHSWRIGGTLDNEPGQVYLYFLDNVSSGAQTVSIPHTSSATTKIATCITVTASGAVYPVGLQGSRVIGGGTAASMGTTQIGTSSSALRFFGAYSGTNAEGNLTALSGTTIVSSHDFGNHIAWLSREDAASTGGDIGASGIGITDDLASIGIALSETFEYLVESYRVTFPGSTTAHAFPLPLSLEAGDLVTLTFGSSINGGTITPSGGPTLTRFDDNTNLSTMVCGMWWFESDGSEDGATIDFVTSTNTNGTGALSMLRIPAALRDTNTDPSATVTGPTANGTPDPSSHSPSWGSANNLWIVSLVRDAADGITSLGSDYADRFFYTTTTGIEIGTSWRFNTASSEDPPASTVGTTDEEFKAYVVAVRPPVAAPVARELDSKLLAGRRLGTRLLSGS